MRNLLSIVIMIFAIATQTTSASSEAILTVVVGDESIAIQREDLTTLDTVTIATGTDWTDGVNTFKGPLIRDVLEFAGVRNYSSEMVSAKAANDYSVEIPAGDFTKYDVILATEMDGEQLTLRDKGPLWIVYPRDEHAELNDPVINSRWIWQLVELSVQ